MIPKRIFAIWLNDDPVLPQKVQDCLKSQQIPGYEHRLITLENCFRGSRYVNEAIAAKKWVKAADLLRVYALWHEGGIYLDADMEVLEGKNFDDLLDNRIFVTKEWNGYFSNAIIGAEQGHAVLERYIQKIEENFRGDGSFVFRPGMQFWSENLFLMNDYAENGIKVYPQDYFLPYNHDTGETVITQNSRTLHHFMKTWNLRDVTAE